MKIDVLSEKGDRVTASLDRLSGLISAAGQEGEAQGGALSSALEGLRAEIDDLLNASASLGGAVEEARASARDARRSSMEVETILNHLADAVVAFDRRGVVMRANGYAVVMFGFEPLHRTAKTIFSRIEVFDEEGQPLPEALLPTSQASQGQVVINQRLKITSRRGRSFDVLASAMPVFTGREYSGTVLILNDITQHVAAEQERQRMQEDLRSSEARLRESQARFMLATEAAGIGAWEHDLRTGEIIWDEQTRRLFGVQATPESTSAMLALIHPDDRIAFETVITHGAKQPGAYELEYRVIWPDGSFHWIFERGRVEPGEDGQPGRLTGVVLDVTERKESEAEREKLLKQVASEHAWLDGVLNELPVSVWIADKDGRVLRSNKRAVEIWAGESRYPQTVAEYGTDLYRGWWSKTGRKVRPDEWPLSVALLKGEPQVGVEIEIERLDGTRGTNLVSAAPVRDNNGSVIGAVAVEQDITESKLVEQELRQREARFRVALANAPITVFEMDRDLRYTWVYNPSMGIPAEHYLGQRDSFLFGAENAAELTAFKLSVLESHTAMGGEFTLQSGDKRFTLVVTAEALRDENGKVIGLTGAALDITERRALEARHIEYATAMEVQRRLLENREMERQRIARELHDGPIQDLIALLFGITATMAESGTAEVRAPLSAVRNSLQEMVNELRVVCNELRPPTLVQFGLERAIRNHAVDFGTRYPGVKLLLDLMEDGRTLSDRLRLALYRIYQEGLNNVLRHSGATEAVIRLSLDPRLVVLEIEDNGSGFPTPIDWVELARGGHLGLVGMKERAEAAGGTIQVDSRPGEGTIVRVEVPLMGEGLKIP